MTAALAEKAVLEGKLDLDATIDRYLGFDTDNSYPTVRELLTHTSGCRGYYMAFPFVKNFFQGNNPYLGVTDDIIMKQAEKLDLKKDSYPWSYSNFGFALIGRILEEVNGESMEEQLSALLAELGMTDSSVNIGKSIAEGGWEWNEGDSYIPAGAVVSTIEDMVKYAMAQLEGTTPFAECHEGTSEIENVPGKWKMMDINADSIGLSWINDEENGFIWHNGGTGSCNSYLGFSPEKKTAVVVLSNLAPSFRIPATVVGIKLLREL